MRCPSCGRLTALARIRCPACKGKQITWYILAVFIVAVACVVALMVLEKVG